MRSANSRKVFNDFHRDSLRNITCYVDPQIFRKLRTLNVTLSIKKHSIYASTRGYFVEWFYDSDTGLYTYISGLENGVVFKDQGDVDSLCDTFGAMFGYDI